MAQQCWEVKNCGCEPGGILVPLYGVCPAATDVKHGGVNGGINAGRCCWKIAGTLCDGETHGTPEEKETICLECEFFHQVIREEGLEFDNSAVPVPAN